MSLVPLHIYFIFLSLLASVYATRSQNTFYRPLRLFPVILFVTLVAELYASYLAYKAKNNVIVYNFLTVFEFCFYLIVLSYLFNNPKAKKAAILVSILYALAALINILFFQSLHVFHTVTYAAGSLLIVGFCINYFLELFRSPKSIKLTRIPAFWICSGLLFFYCVSFPLYGFIHAWMSVKFIVDNFLNIVTILNVFLYTMFIIAFLCNRTRKYTLSSS